MPEQQSEEPKSPAEELVDLLVFAPLGLALECLEKLPDYVERGRKQASFAQSIGKMALGGFGRKAPPAKAPAKPTTTTKPTTTKPTAKPTTVAKSTTTTNQTKKPAPPANVVAKDKSAQEPIPGYSKMSAREIIATISSLSTDALDALEAAEQAGKGRVTVLRAISAQRAR